MTDGTRAASSSSDTEPLTQTATFAWGISSLVLPASTTSYSG